MVFKLGNNIFKTKSETIDFIRHLVKTNVNNDIKKGNIYFETLNDLIKLHPEYNEKRGDGIEYFHIKKHPKYNNFCIWIKQKNKCDLLDFSWYECLKKNKTSTLKDLKKAFRITIEPQINKYKNTLKKFKCELCSSENNPQVDHIIHFEKLVKDFLKINKEPIPSKFNKNNLLELEFKKENIKIKNNWYKYHLQNSKLRILCRDCNLSRTKYKIDNLDE